MHKSGSRLRWLPCLMLSAMLALLAGGAGVGAAQAQEAAASPAAAITRDIRETVLPNGLRVLTKEVRTAPVAHFSVWYAVGSRNEHTGITGVSHLLEHLLFKGTKKYRLGEISRSLFVNGADYNAGTYFDWTNYWETLASDRLELAMQIEADRMVNSRIDKADLDSEMSVVRSELEGGENDPSELLRNAVVATAYTAHPYHWPIIGYRSDVENVSRDQIYDYYKRYYGPNNATIVMVGDFDTDEALELVRKHFGKLKPIPTPPPVYTQEPPQRGERRVTVRRAGSLPMAMIGYRTPAAKDPDFYALDALGTILGDGRTSRLYQGLVETQLATDVSAGAPSLKDPFLFMFNAMAAPGVSAEKLETALLEQIERVKNEPVTAQELQRAKTKLEADFVFRSDSVAELADLIGYWQMAVDWKYLTTYLDRIRALTPADLQRVAQKYFVRDTQTVGHFIPAESAGEEPPAPRVPESSARVDKPGRGDRPIPLPKPSKSTAVARKVDRFKLDNGIEVVVQNNTSSPTFALRGSLPAGRVFEPKGKAGLAGITAALLTRGTEDRPPLDFATSLENVGASLTASSGNLAVNLGGQAQSQHFNLLMDLLGDMLREPTFREEEIERLKSQILAGLSQEADDPSSLAMRAFRRAVYPEGHPLRPETLEEAARQVRSITRDDVVNFYRQQYGPDRMILVVVGNVTADQVREQLRLRLGDWARNASARAIPNVDLPAAARADRITIPVPDKSETSVVWGHAGGLRRSDPDFYATQVMNMILGGGGALNSRLGNTIRDEQGLVYDVYSFYDADLYSGPVLAALGTNPANASRALEGLEKEIARIREQGVTQREVEEAVAYITGSYPVSLATNNGLADALWRMEFYDLGPDYLDRFGELYRSVTVEQVNRAAQEHLKPGQAVRVIAGPGAQ
ncbi:MAG: M16 family metallopeptidase [Armatimonadota bacterium]